MSENPTLADFIKTVVVDIAKGASEAGAELQPLGGVVNPIPYGTSDIDSHTKRTISKIDFEVNLEVRNTTETKAGIFVSMLSVGAGASGASGAAASTTHKISFSIPVVLPTAQAYLDARERQRRQSVSDVETNLRGYGGSIA